MKAMPRTRKRRPYLTAQPPRDGRPYYEEGDRDYLLNNADACLWFLENAQLIRKLVKAYKHSLTSEGALK